MPPVDWKGLFGFASQIPAVRRAIGATLEELEHNPNFQRFVERYQGMNAAAASKGGVARAECMICLFHRYGVEQNLNTLDVVPRHRCADHAGEWFP